MNCNLLHWHVTYAKINLVLFLAHEPCELKQDITVEIKTVQTTEYSSTIIIESSWLKCLVILVVASLCLQMAFIFYTCFIEQFQTASYSWCLHCSGYLLNAVNVNAPYIGYNITEILEHTLLTYITQLVQLFYATIYMRLFCFILMSSDKVCTYFFLQRSNYWHARLPLRRLLAGVKIITSILMLV